MKKLTDLFGLFIEYLILIIAAVLLTPAGWIGMLTLAFILGWIK